VLDLGTEVEIIFTPTSSYVMDYEGSEKEMRKWINNHAIKDVLTEDLRVALRHCEESENYEWARKIQKEIKRREKDESKKS
jgi:hydrogenase maturation factor HypE